MPPPFLLGRGLRRFEHPCIMVLGSFSITWKLRVILIISLILRFIALILALDNPNSTVPTISSRCYLQLCASFLKGSCPLCVALQQISLNMILTSSPLTK